MNKKFKPMIFPVYCTDCGVCPYRSEKIPRRMRCPTTPAIMMQVKMQGECVFDYYRVSGPFAGYRFFVFKEEN